MRHMNNDRIECDAWACRRYKRIIIETAEKNDIIDVLAAKEMESDNDAWTKLHCQTSNVLHIKI